jgi:hypothetical protein
MNNTNTGGRAFPAPTTKPLENYYPGISVRYYFAAKAMQGMLSDPSCQLAPERLVQLAYQYADAMLKAKEQK